MLTLDFTTKTTTGRIFAVEIVGSLGPSFFTDGPRAHGPKTFPKIRQPSMGLYGNIKPVDILYLNR